MQQEGHRKEAIRHLKHAENRIFVSLYLFRSDIFCMVLPPVQRLRADIFEALIKEKVLQLGSQCFFYIL